MAENVGSIYYEVEADTSKLVNSSGTADKSLDGLNKRFDRTDKAAAKSAQRLTKVAASVQGLGRNSGVAGAAIGGLATILSSIASLKTAAALVQMAESYNEMAERIRFATSSTAEYEKVQSRLLTTANGTYRALSEAQEVYIMTADSLRSVGYSTDQVLDITDSLSYAFVKNATSSERAASAMSAYTKSVNKGKVDTENWQSILMAVPTVVNDIAAATGRSSAQVRALGFSGKLAAKDLNEGLRQSLDANKAAADGMATTVKDSLIAVRNNLQAYIGEANRATGVTTSLSGAISRVAEAIHSADPGDLVREINAMKSAMEMVNDLANDWLEPFNLGIEETASLFSTSFSESFLATGKEIDTIAADFQGFFGGVEKAVGVLGGNIETIFSNAWNAVLSGAEGMLNGLIDGYNKLAGFVSGPQISQVSLGSGVTRETVNLIDAYAEGYHKAAKGVGAHNAILDKMAEKVDLIASYEWQSEYGEETNKAAGATNNLTEATGKLSAAQKKAIKDQEANKQAINDLAQSLLMAGLAGEELAVTKAKLALNPAATPEEVAQVEALARALWAVDEAEKAKKKFGDDPMKHIKGNVSPLSGGEFDDQTARYEAEAVAEQERYAAQQLRLQEALDLQLVTREQYAEQELAFAQTHADRIGQIERAKTSVMLKSASQGFGAIADIMKSSQGEQSGIYKAMFAASKAFAIADATVNAYAAISKAWNSAPFPANLGAVAATTPQVMAVVSSISGASIGGGRQYGGPVAPGSMHRINENGAPEILNMANGQQYLLPNSRGEVVSNKDAQGGKGGQVSVTVILNENPDRAGQIEQSSGTDEQGQIIEVFVADIYGGGKASDAMERAYGLTRRGT